MAARNLLVCLAVVVLIDPSLSLEWFDESDVQRLFEVDSIDKAPEHVVVYPQVVTGEGAFAVTGDALSSDTLRLTFQAFGEDFDLSLQRDDFGIAPDFEMTIISKEGTRKLPIRIDCLYSGKWNSDPESLVTAETSDGLHVMIYRNGGPIYVTPLMKDHRASQRGLGLAHVAYKGPNAIHCATDNTMGPTILPSKPARKSSTSEPARTSSKKTLELALVSDYELYRKLGDETSAKTLRLYTQAVGLLKLPSLSSGNLDVKLAVHTTITDPNVLATSTDTWPSLDACIDYSGANWKLPGEEGHFDNAAYITGFDIGGPLTVGYAYIGICGRKQAASLSEYLGPEGYAPVVAHEIAHNLGCEHDAAPCSPTDYFMSPYLDPGHSEWSTCSKSYYNAFVGSAMDPNGVSCYDDGGL